MASIFYCPSCSKFHFNELKDDEFLVSCPHCYKRTGVDTGILKETYDSMSDVDKNNLKQDIKNKYTKEYVDDLIRQKTGLVYNISGFKSTLVVYEDRVELSKGSILFASTNKTIPIQNITSVSVTPSTVLYGRGFIEFSVPGGKDSKNINEAINNENAFLLNMSGQNELAMEVKSYIDKRIMHYTNLRNQPTQTIVQQSVSAADELIKFKQLLDMGIITQEEFDTKKKQLLGL